MVETSWRHQAHRRAMIVFDQLQAALRAAPSDADARAFVERADNPYFRLLDDLYGQDYQLGRLLDTSDLITHAEGTSLEDALPALRATTWLCETTNKHLRRLVVATMDLSHPARRALERAIDLRLTGFAPGSLYAGFKLMPSGPDLLCAYQDPVYLDGRAALVHLPDVPRYIDEESVLPDLAEVIPDPALRDASLMAAYHLAPTGRLGIHTLELSTPGSAPAQLGQRERVVLSQALRQPSREATATGRFVGEVRAMDLDTSRLHLRNVAGIGTLRCVLPEVDRARAKQLIGEHIAVSARYAVDAEGRPRLLWVDSPEAIEVLPKVEQASIGL